MTNTKHKVARTDLWLHANFEERLAREADIELSICRVLAPAAETQAVLEQSHVFHVSPTKDDLPRHMFVDAEFLRRCPQLLVVSSSGAGYDTIDAPACTAAGVALVNQAGGNAVSVAELAIGLMLDVSRRISESDRRLRRERGFTREAVMGYEVAGKTIGCGIAWTFTPATAVDICDGTNVAITIVSTVTNALCGSTYSATRTWRSS